MNPELILHIGAPKCGSSSIQAFLRENKKHLETAGYIVPDEKLRASAKVSGNHVWFLQSFKDDLDKGKTVIQDRLLTLRDKLSDDKGGVIISAENLSDRFGLQYLFSSLQDHFRIRVVVYVRRQDDFLLSSWQQWYVKTAKDFWTWVLRSIAVQKRGDWLYTLQPWIDTFGVETITVRRFGRQYFPSNDLLTDFCTCVGLDTGNLNLKIGQENTGVSDTAIQFAFALQDVFESAHDNDFYHMIRRWGGEAARKTDQSNLLSFTQRNAILCHYAESNKKIRDLFFADENVPDSLFNPPARPAADPPRETGIDPHSELLMRLVYGAYKEFGALHKFEKVVEALKRNISGRD